MRWETARRKVYAALMDIYRHGNPTKMLKMRKYFESKQNDYIRDTLEYMSEEELSKYISDLRSSYVYSPNELMYISDRWGCLHRVIYILSTIQYIRDGGVAYSGRDE